LWNASTEMSAAVRTQQVSFRIPRRRLGSDHGRSAQNNCAGRANEFENAALCGVGRKGTIGD
jgi:hypothetical protein